MSGFVSSHLIGGGGGCVGGAGAGVLGEVGAGGVGREEGGMGVGGGGGLKLALPKIDLAKTRELAHEPTETQKRVEKLQSFEHLCSRVRDYLFVSGVSVAQVPKP
jgi:hypothetical protein